MNVEPVTLQGQRIRLVPLTLDHLDALCAIGLDPSLWTHTGGRYETRDDMQTYIENGLAREDALPFVMTIRDTGEVVGCTRFGTISTKHRRVEIGWTWIAAKWQRTFVNTEVKYLMLTHAFETWGCQRVEFKTHVDNRRSRNAILRIGAKEEGVFRNHMIQPDGTSRDSVFFSITDAEWPQVRERLEAMRDRS